MADLGALPWGQTAIRLRGTTPDPTAEEAKSTAASILAALLTAKRHIEDGTRELATGCTQTEGCIDALTANDIPSTLQERVADTARANAQIADRARRMGVDSKAPRASLFTRTEDRPVDATDVSINHISDATLAVFTVAGGFATAWGLTWFNTTRPPTLIGTSPTGGALLWYPLVSSVLEHDLGDPYNVVHVITLPTLETEEPPTLVVEEDGTLHVVTQPGSVYAAPYPWPRTSPSTLSRRSTVFGNVPLPEHSAVDVVVHAIRTSAGVAGTDIALEAASSTKAPRVYGYVCPCLATTRFMQAAIMCQESLQNEQRLALQLISTIGLSSRLPKTRRAFLAAQRAAACEQEMRVALQEVEDWETTMQRLAVAPVDPVFNGLTTNPDGAVWRDTAMFTPWETAYQQDAVAGVATPKFARGGQPFTLTTSIPAATPGGPRVTALYCRLSRCVRLYASNGATAAFSLPGFARALASAPGCLIVVYGNTVTLIRVNLRTLVPGPWITAQGIQDCSTEGVLEEGVAPTSADAEDGAPRRPRTTAEAFLATANPAFRRLLGAKDDMLAHCVDMPATIKLAGMGSAAAIETVCKGQYVPGIQLAATVPTPDAEVDNSVVVAASGKRAAGPRSDTTKSTKTRDDEVVDLDYDFEAEDEAAAEDEVALFLRSAGDPRRIDEHPAEKAVCEPMANELPGEGSRGLARCPFFDTTFEDTGIRVCTPTPDWNLGAVSSGLTMQNVSFAPECITRVHARVFEGAHGERIIRLVMCTSTAVVIVSMLETLVNATTDTWVVPDVPTIGYACVDNIKDVFTVPWRHDVVLCRRHTSQMVTPLRLVDMPTHIKVQAMQDINATTVHTRTREGARFALCTGDVNGIAMCTTSPPFVTRIAL